MAAMVDALCRLEDVPDGGSRGFGDRFAVRRGTRIYVYRNACPHLGVPLDWAPDRFLSRDGRRIVCAAHGAEFRVEDGFCTAGPCRGEYLRPVPVEVLDGVVLLRPEPDQPGQLTFTEY